MHYLDNNGFSMNMWCLEDAGTYCSNNHCLFIFLVLFTRQLPLQLEVVFGSIFLSVVAILLGEKASELKCTLINFVIAICGSAEYSSPFKIAMLSSKWTKASVVNTQRSVLRKLL